MTPNDRNRKTEELEGLSSEEAKALGEIADALRADRFEPRDDRFWDALHRRIRNEIEVTPLPSRGGWRSGLRRAVEHIARVLVPETGRGRLALAGVVALAVLVFVMLVSRQARWPLEPLPAPEQLLSQRIEPAPSTASAAPAPIEIPEELWEEGFFANRPIAADEIDWESWETADVEIDSGWWDEAFDTDEADEADFITTSSVDPFAWETGADWGLDSLSEEELETLADMLGG